MDKQEKHSTYSELESVDKTCVHVSIVIGIVFVLLAYISYPEGIFNTHNTHFAKLTMGTVLRLILTVMFGALAILIFIDVVALFIRWLRS
jgi:hypothetical protein